MKRIGFTLLLAVVVGATPHANAQVSAQSSGQTSASVSKQGTQASANSATGASAAAQAGQENTALSGGAAVNATLNAPLDSKKCKPGDPVTAKTSEAVKSDGRTVFPKGTKIVGHVTRASSRAKGDSESAIGMVFDKAILKNGEEVPVNLAIQAIASAQTSEEIAASDVDTTGSMGGSAAATGMAGGRGALGGVGSAAGGTAGTLTNTAANVGGNAGGALNSTANATGTLAGASSGAVGGLNSAGQLTSSSQGVFGLHGLNLSSAASNSTEGSLITSAGKNVHLDSGTRMLLVTQSHTGAGAAGESKAPKSSKPASRPDPQSPREKPTQE